MTLYYIIGGGLLFVIIITAILVKMARDKKTKKILNRKKYSLVEVGIKATDTNYRAYLLKDILLNYGMATHDSGIRIECRILKGDKVRDSRLKQNESAFEIVAKTSDGQRVIGKPYFRKFKKVAGKDMVFTPKALSGYPYHLANALKY
jgi:hypothetical protein